ncbi:MAG: signal peptidase II [Paracoccaceae bacterium]
MRLVWWAAILAFAVDQASKYVVVHMMSVQTRGPIEVFPPLLRFIYGENHGINFGLGQGISRWALIALAGAICLWLLWWIRQANATPVAKICAGLVIGGALGNVIDRLIYGYVLDFLNMSCCGINNPFVFNVADIFIFAGAIGLVLVTPDPKKRA